MDAAKASPPPVNFFVQMPGRGASVAGNAMISTLHSFSKPALWAGLFLLTNLVWADRATADSCHRNLVRMSRELQNLADDLNDELSDELDDSSLRHHVLHDAEKLEDLAHEIEEMAEDGETDCRCFERTLANLHHGVHHLESLLHGIGHGRRRAYCLDKPFNLLARIDSLIVRMERSLESWDVSLSSDRPFGDFQPVGLNARDPNWSATGLEPPMILVPVGGFRAIPLR
jgi:hypothetical protein